MSFKKWMEKVDELLVKQCGLTHECLADCAYYDSWASGVTPEEMMEEVLEEEGFPVE